MTAKKRQGRLLPFAAGSRGTRRRSGDQADPSLTALLAHWHAPDPSSALDRRVMTSAQRLLAPRRRRRVWRAIAVAAGVILTVAVVDRSSLSAAEQIVRQSLAQFGRAASKLLGVAGYRPAVAPLPGRASFSAEAPVPFAAAATRPVPLRKATAPRLDDRARVALEVRALSLLARGQMLAGAQIEVTRSEAGITIRGVTDTLRQRQSLLAALGAFVQSPGVSVEIGAATELARTRPRHSSTPQMRVVEIAPEERDVDPERRAAMNRALATSREVLVHALSLRHLTPRFSAAAHRDMSVATQSEWRSLLRSTVELVRQQAHDLRTHLQPLMSAVADDGASREGVDAAPLAASEDALTQAAQEMVDAAMAIDEQIRGAFTRSSRPAALDEALLARALERLEALAAAAAPR